jgi:hypothetical protein
LSIQKNYGYRKGIVFEVFPARSGHGFPEKGFSFINTNLSQGSCPKSRAAHGDMSRSEGRGIEVF